MAMFRDFHNENLRLFILNFRIIMLVPGLSEATKTEQYCHICMPNVSFKIFSKVIAIDCPLWLVNSLGPHNQLFFRTVYFRWSCYLA
jgi:hypothetical protein